jgi:Cu/Ag efflux protein CusF
MKTALNATLLALTLAFGSAHAADAKPATSEPGTPAVIAGDVVKAEAEVVGIDKKTRTVTLKGEDGNVFDVVVGKEAKNFKQIKVGDRVIAEHMEVLTMELKKGGGLRETVEKDIDATAKPGQKPGAIRGREIDFVADVKSVDAKASTITILGASGRMYKLKVKDPKVMAEIKEGDQVKGTYVVATGIAVVAPKAKAAK